MIQKLNKENYVNYIDRRQTSFDGSEFEYYYCFLI